MPERQPKSLEGLLGKLTQYNRALDQVGKVRAAIGTPEFIKHPKWDLTQPPDESSAAAYNKTAIKVGIIRRELREKTTLILTSHKQDVEQKIIGNLIETGDLPEYVLENVHAALPNVKPEAGKPPTTPPIEPNQVIFEASPTEDQQLEKDEEGRFPQWLVDYHQRHPGKTTFSMDDIKDATGRIGLSKEHREEVRRMGVEFGVDTSKRRPEFPIEPFDQIAIKIGSPDPKRVERSLKISERKSSLTSSGSERKTAVEGLVLDEVAGEEKRDGLSDNLSPDIQKRLKELFANNPGPYTLKDALQVLGRVSPFGSKSFKPIDEIRERHNLKKSVRGRGWQWTRDALVEVVNKFSPTPTEISQRNRKAANVRWNKLDKSVVDGTPNPVLEEAVEGETSEFWLSEGNRLLLAQQLSHPLAIKKYEELTGISVLQNDLDNVTQIIKRLEVLDHLPMQKDLLDFLTYFGTHKEEITESYRADQEALLLLSFYAPKAEEISPIELFLAMEQALEEDHNDKLGAISVVEYVKGEFTFTIHEVLAAAQVLVARDKGWILNGHGARVENSERAEINRIIKDIEEERSKMGRNAPDMKNVIPKLREKLNKFPANKDAFFQQNKGDATTVLEVIGRMTTGSFAFVIDKLFPSPIGGQNNNNTWQNVSGGRPPQNVYTSRPGQGGRRTP